MQRKRERKAELKKIDEDEEEEKKKSNKLKFKSGAFGKGGRLNSSGTYAQYIMKNTIKNTMRDQDPREVLLARAKETESNPLFVSQAYK